MSEYMFYYMILFALLLIDIINKHDKNVGMTDELMQKLQDFIVWCCVFSIGALIYMLIASFDATHIYEPYNFVVVFTIIIITHKIAKWCLWDMHVRAKID